MSRKITHLASLQGHDFKKYIRQEVCADVKIRLLGLSHIQDGKSCRDTAKMVKSNEYSVQAWVRRFAVGGVSALRRQPGQGLRKRVNVQDFPEIKKGILLLQPASTGGRIRGTDIQKYLQEIWTISYKISAIYKLLKDLKIVWISARSKHPMSTQAVQYDFKKNLSNL